MSFKISISSDKNSISRYLTLEKHGSVKKYYVQWEVLSAPQMTTCEEHKIQFRIPKRQIADLSEKRSIIVMIFKPLDT